jgi:hypothetical protein
MYYVLTVVFGIVASVLTLSIIVGAFRQSVGQGLLALFVPLYALIFAFSKWTYGKRAMVGGGQLIASVGLALCVVMSIKTAAADVAEALQHPSPAAAMPGSTSGSSAGASKLPIVATCSISYPGRGQAVCTELHGTSVPVGAADKCKGDEGTFVTGSTPCSPAGATGKCEHATEIEFSYAGAVGDPKGSCEALGNTWTALSPATAAAPASATAPAAPAKAAAAPAKAAAAPKAKGHK